MKSLISYFQKLFPKNCIICKLKSDTELELCQICYQSLPWLQNACYQCGARLENIHESIRCRKCIISPPMFDRLCALFDYEFPIDRVILQLKFKYKLAYGNLLGQLLLQQYKTWYALEAMPEAILPVPLSKTRLKKRGFNQTIEILRPLILSSNFIVLSNSCIRTKNTKSQTSMSMRYRRRNLRSAFCLTKSIPYKHVAIIDDVFTTGSTIQAVSEMLRSAGVEQIDVWCICRTQSLRESGSIQYTHQTYKPFLLK